MLYLTLCYSVQLSATSHIFVHFDNVFLMFLNIFLMYIFKYYTLVPIPVSSWCLFSLTDFFTIFSNLFIHWRFLTAFYTFLKMDSEFCYLPLKSIEFYQQQSFKLLEILWIYYVFYYLLGLAYFNFLLSPRA